MDVCNRLCVELGKGRYEAGGTWLQYRYLPDGPTVLTEWLPGPAGRVRRVTVLGGAEQQKEVDPSEMDAFIDSLAEEFGRAAAVD
jgi:hypothetical protein